MDPRVRAVDGDTMVNEMRQNIEIMLRKKKHAVQVRKGEGNKGEHRCAAIRDSPPPPSQAECAFLPYFKERSFNSSHLI